MAIHCGSAPWHTYQLLFFGVNVWMKLALDYVPKVLNVMALVSIPLSIAATIRAITLCTSVQGWLMARCMSRLSTSNLYW